MTTKYTVTFIEGNYSRVIAEFDNKNDAVKFAKNELIGTDGSFVLVVIGMENCNYVYSKTFTAIDHKPRVVR